jgi:hypothetical protein
VEAATIHHVPRWGIELRAGALPLRLQVGALALEAFKKPTLHLVAFWR